MATGYNTDGSEDPLLNLGWAAPAGQMYSTINDLMKVCWIVLMGILLISASAVQFINRMAAGLKLLRSSHRCFLLSPPFQRQFL